MYVRNPRGQGENLELNLQGDLGTAGKIAGEALKRLPLDEAKQMLQGLWSSTAAEQKLAFVAAAGLGPLALLKYGLQL